MLKPIDSLLFGADPEVLLQTTGDGAYIPAWNITKGTKDSHQIIDTKKGIDIHADGVALEINFKPSTVSGALTSAQSALNTVYKYLLREGVTMNYVPYVEEKHFDAKTLMHPLALMSGCDPDFSAYSKIKGEPRAAPDTRGYKFFGGHIHIGYDTKVIETYAFIRMIEGLIYTGIIEQDVQGPRRKTYGLAGLYRPKSYGVEWRTPSPFWLREVGYFNHIAAKVHDIYAALLSSPKKVNTWYHQVNWGEVEEAISQEDVGACHTINDRLSTQFREITGEQ